MFFGFSTGYTSVRDFVYIIMRIKKMLRHEETARDQAVFKLSLSERTHNKTRYFWVQNINPALRKCRSSACAELLN